MLPSGSTEKIAVFELRIANHNAFDKDFHFENEF